MCSQLHTNYYIRTICLRPQAIKQCGRSMDCININRAKGCMVDGLEVSNYISSY